MPAIQIPGTNITYGWQEREDGWSGGMNTNLVVLGYLAKGSVLSRSIGVPPADPDEGDRYIVPVDPSGEWAGHDNEVAMYLSGAWIYIEPFQIPMLVVDEEVHVYWDGSEYQLTKGAEQIDQLNALVEQAQQAATTSTQNAQQTAADRVATGQDAQATAADRVQTGQDRTVSTSAAQSASEDAQSTAADRIATGEDRAQTGQDRVATGEDATQTAADRAATGEDRTATAADRVQTGQDRTATSGLRDESEQFRNDAQAAAASLNLPTIQPGDAGRGLVVNAEEDGYETTPIPSYSIVPVVLSLTGGDFASGTLTCVKIGNQVTLSTTGALPEFSSSTIGGAASAAVPASMRPTGSVTNTCATGLLGAYVEVAVSVNGDFIVQFQANQTTFPSHVSITYNI